jgi:Phage integrase family
MRWGEVAALRRSDIALDGSSIRIARAIVELPGRGIVFGPPKSQAGVREVAVPEAIRDDLLKQITYYVGQHPESLLFTGELSGGPVRRSSSSPRVKWSSIIERLGMKGVHFHDLRHAGNIWASKSGTSTRDLMARMGHDDMRAALIYQRATSDADDGSPRSCRPWLRHITRACPRLNGTLMAQTGPLSRVEVREDAVLVLLTCPVNMEPMTGIEPAYSAWEADVLPLNYIGLFDHEG